MYSSNMALYKGKPVMIGAFETESLSDFDDKSLWRSNASYFEAYDPESKEWSDLKRTPFLPEYTKEYFAGTSVTKEDSFLVFGGRFYYYEGRSYEF